MDANIQDLFEREGVTFVGKGKKIKNGIQTDEDAIIIGVEEKKLKSELTKSQLLPSFIEGQKTDIVQTGKIVKRGYEEERRTEKSRPIQPGTSCGHYAITAGTFGAVVYSEGTQEEPPEEEPPPIEPPDDDHEEDIIPCPDVPNKEDCEGCDCWTGTGCFFDEDPPKDTSWLEDLIAYILYLLNKLFGGWLEDKYTVEKCSTSKAYILSNNHVLANENKASLGDPIRQPGGYDGGTKDDNVAVLSDYVTIYKSKVNKVDCALAEITTEYNPEILDIGVPKGTADIGVGDYITKSGRTTGTTRAKVIAVDAYTSVEYDMGFTEWEGQIITGQTDDGEMSSDGGDSGSLGVDDNGYAVGLLFAGSDEVTVYNPIGDVLSSLKIKVSF